LRAVYGGLGGQVGYIFGDYQKEEQVHKALHLIIIPVVGNALTAYEGAATDAQGYVNWRTED